MNLIRNLSKNTLLSLAITSTLLAGCDSDNNSAELARAIELEEQRTLGTLIESVTIVGAQTRLKADETHQLTATGIDSNGAVRVITSELTWSSSDTSIATVNSSGLVTAVANSDIDQGKVIITGTTIFDIIGEGEMSVSDVAVSTFTLKQTSPETGNINTCIDASIKGDVSYEDGYLSLDSVKDMTFTLDDQTSAAISTDGTLYTSAVDIENTTITSTIGSISAELIVTADPANLDTMDILMADEVTTAITLTMGDRIQVNAQANLIEAVSTESYNIDPSVNWLQRDTNLLGITETGDNKGSILALIPGTTELTATCGGKEAKTIIIVEGSAALTSMQVTDADSAIVDNAITIAPLDTIDLTLTANYDATPTSLNISEYASWEVLGENVSGDTVSLELIDAGTSAAYYQLTSTSSSTGSVVISFTYEGETDSLTINITE